MQKLITINYIACDIVPSKIFGISRYQVEIHERLKDKVKLNWISYSPSKFPLLGKLFDYYIKYPVKVKLRILHDSITHIPNPRYAHLFQIIDISKLNNKTIATFYDVEPSIMFQDKKTLIHWYLCRKGLMRADKIVTLSTFQKREIIKFFGYDYPEEKIEVVPEGVDTNRFRKLEVSEIESTKKKIERNMGDIKIILFVGSEHPRKNFERVLYAIHALKKEYENFKLFKIGKPEIEDYRKRNLKIIRDLRLDKYVTFFDHVEDTELVKYYNISECLILPTLYEGGFALPILEAFACKTPVITSNIPPIIELTEGKGAIFVDPYDVKQITEALKNLLYGDIDRDEIAEEGYNIAKKYNWNNSAEKMYKIYKELNKK
ncbi:MAG: glycosyltransferase family 1 protein [Nitrososphaerota archaeon]